MAKSPINILQEISIKDGYFPSYLFVTVNNQFMCKVTCKDLSTDGSGSNKKEAKQNAAQNMLLMLNEKNEISISPLRQTIYRTANEVQDTLTKSYEITDKKSQDGINMCSLLRTQSNPKFNYVGILQELCVQYKLCVLPSYRLIDEKGPSHMRTFTMEANIGFLKDTGTAHCKRSAKQEAAKNLLQCLEKLNVFSTKTTQKDRSCKETCEDDLQEIDIELSNIKRPIQSEPIQSQPVAKQLEKTVESIFNSAGMQNLAVKNSHTNILPAEPIKDGNCKQILENDLRKLNIEISDFNISEPTLPVSELSEEAQSIYIATTSNKAETQNLSLKDCHTLFKTKYFSKIPDNLKEKMQRICEANNFRSYLIEGIKQDIQTILGVKIKQMIFNNCETGLVIICLRLLSTPIITQFGIGKTAYEAENRAMCEIINTIMDFLQ